MWEEATALAGAPVHYSRAEGPWAAGTVGRVSSCGAGGGCYNLESHIREHFYQKIIFFSSHARTYLSTAHRPFLAPILSSLLFSPPLFILGLSPPTTHAQPSGPSPSALGIL